MSPGCFNHNFLFLFPHITPQKHRLLRLTTLCFIAKLQLTLPVAMKPQHILKTHCMTFLLLDASCVMSYQLAMAHSLNIPYDTPRTGCIVYHVKTLTSNDIVKLNHSKHYPIKGKHWRYYFLTNKQYFL